ncbi:MULTISPECIES: MlaA family lipoprotein [Roseovarius]|jgi:phospholipid-binding lipoprotein MlaA|uniref:VacJ lipoprotein, putative n=2 Tax=Roseovarius nubinhibens TaxID=314263 RepID=A3SM39_ROSNI|nr:VacJ family lipoprotein [Roseovarius nubinhibens]EAP78420.1 VacJ lipoprotein, putative [Roseovarius nubinhibens ISM]MBU3000251.1 VacJ family lipoprotein [Roseovarius nubinhibens]HAR51215.1 VacJ family lipoprotein [Roseovarius nubinhibens]|tara:strand:+ start:970 stop:1842 length:873 start_codon:yes stop_codon:yes gene_type:complete
MQRIQYDDSGLDLVKLLTLPLAPRRLFAALALAGVTALSACGQSDPALTRDAPYDPWEAENRKVHNFNKSLDRNIVRPTGKGYTAAVPDDIETVVSRFAENLTLPRSILNNILQGNGLGATTDTYRLLVNTTLGLGGFFDPATELNMPARTNADFGQTLYVWGVNQGPYIELPLLGPSTTRETVGMTVDLIINPLNYVLPSPESFYGTAASVSSSLSARGQYSDTIDSVLHESADSYRASQSLYLQNRRFKLGKGRSDTYLDPYDAVSGDPYGETSAAASGDPYEDPYNE